MKHKFFNIPVADPVNAETELNAFIAQHRITHIDRHFVADGANSFWSKHLRQYRYYGKIDIAGYFANFYPDGLDRLLAGLPTSPSAIDSMINRGDRSKRDSARIVRGGSWNNNGRNVRSANRNRNTPDNRNNNLGFRLALAQQAMIGLNDPIVIPSCNHAGKQQDRRHVSNGSGCPVDACRTVVLSLLDKISNHLKM